MGPTRKHFTVCAHSTFHFYFHFHALISNNQTTGGYGVGEEQEGGSVGDDEDGGLRREVARWRREGRKEHN